MKRRGLQPKLIVGDRHAKLVELWPQRIPMTEIADALNAMPGPTLTVQQVRARGNHLYLGRRPYVQSPEGRAVIAKATKGWRRKWSPERDEALRRGWLAGEPVATIAATISGLDGAPISVRALRRRRVALGLPPRSAGGPGAPPRLFTPERHAVVMRRWSDPVTLRQVMEELNELPGPQIKNPKQIMQHARDHGAPKRQPVYTAEGRRICGQRAREALRGRSDHWNQARDDLLRRMWSQGMRLRDIRDAANLLPGPAIASINTLFQRARFLELPARKRAQPVTTQAASKRNHAAPRPATARRPKAPSADQAPAMIRVVAPAPAALVSAPPRALPPLPPAEPERPPLSAEEEAAIADARVADRLAKARQMLKQHSDPTVIVAKTRLPLREVFRLQAELRREGAAA